jgi:amidase
MFKGIHIHDRQAHDGLLLQLAAQIEWKIKGKWTGGQRGGVHVAPSVQVA